MLFFGDLTDGSKDGDGLLAGCLRLRLPEGDRALVRELHIYGQEVPLQGKGGIQHAGFGSRLLEEAEDGRSRMLIISGVGVREYYRRHGYNLNGPYMEKRL